jgi:hypothetical protein
MGRAMGRATKKPTATTINDDLVYMSLSYPAVSNLGISQMMGRALPVEQ